MVITAKRLQAVDFNPGPLAKRPMSIGSLVRRTKGQMANGS